MQNRPIIAVIDGLGGGIGCQLCTRIRQAFGQRVEILALGTNSTATEKMIKAGADRGASGENAIQVSIRSAQVVLGPIGVVLPNSLMGEITPRMAQSIMRARSKKIFLPVGQTHFALAGVSPVPLSKLIEEAVGLLAAELDESLANKPEKQ